MHILAMANGQHNTHLDIVKRCTQGQHEGTQGLSLSQDSVTSHTLLVLVRVCRHIGVRTVQQQQVASNLATLLHLHRHLHGNARAERVATQTVWA